MIESGATPDDGALPSGNNGSPPAALWGFWTTAAWALVVAVIFATVQTGTILVVGDLSAANPGDLSFTQLMNSGIGEGYSFSLATFLTTIACCAAIVAIVRLKKGTVLREYLGFKPVTIRAMLKWLGLFLAVVSISDLGLMWFDEPFGKDFMSEIYTNAKPVWMLWLALVLAAPLFEEMFFRGFLLTGFAASFMRPIGAVTVTAALWAAMHLQYNAVGIAVVFCFGLVLGAARIRTDSLMVPLILHALENLLASVAAAILD
jgi:membrane protease YdiL (CAAX protease family)